MLISPLWAIALKGWARFQLGAVLVENLWWKIAYLETNLSSFKSKKKSEAIKASLSVNSDYNGYGSAKSLEKKESNKKTKKNKVVKPKFSNAGFSAYSTN